MISFDRIYLPFQLRISLKDLFGCLILWDTMRMCLRFLQRYTLATDKLSQRRIARGHNSFAACQKTRITPVFSCFPTGRSCGHSKSKRFLLLLCTQIAQMSTLIDAIASSMPEERRNNNVRQWATSKLLIYIIQIQHITGPLTYTKT